MDTLNVRHAFFDGLLLAFFLEVGGIMDLSIVSNEDCVYIIQLIHQLHPFFIAQQEADGAHGVGSERRVGDDGNAVQVILAGCAGGRIQNMMVDGAVLGLKVSLINPGGYHRLVLNFHGGDGLSAFREWFLDGNIEICAVCLGSDSLDLSLIHI